MTPPDDFNPVFFDLEIDGDIAVATFHQQQMTEDDNVEELGEALFSLVDHYHYRKIVLSLGSVRYVTSSVLGKLISLHRKLRRDEGRVVLCDLHDGLQHILNTAQLLTYFESAADVDAAKAMLQTSDGD